MNVTTPMAKYVFLLDLKNWFNTAYAFYLKFLSSDKSIAQKMGAVLTIKSDPSGTNVTLDK